MGDKVIKSNPVGTQTLFNVLLDSAGDEEAQRSGRVSLEEGKQMLDEFLHLNLVLAFVKPVDDD
ncbi:hypothetical protein EST38_g13708 [Candolleomyces aberdarensis]|uniref:Uncharacterized protein n=1 Tax=Candolleomyces aberdarensis TaxID=2316362 RepID=A0A4Q2D1Y0_9AGAR|nr:hypothetical protein EST38_g13708 [Candolleomyces aberdarensis]